jgi:hypothetical protein
MPEQEAVEGMTHMSLGTFLRQKIKQKGIKNIFEKNEAEFREMGLEWGAFKQKIYRTKDLKGYDLFTDMKLLQIILKTLPLNFDDMLKEYETESKKTEVPPSINNEADDKAKGYELLKDIKSDIDYIRRQIDRKSTRKTNKIIKYFFYCSFLNDVYTRSEAGEPFSNFYPLWLKGEPASDLEHIRVKYLEYFPKDKIISDYFYNFFEDKINIDYSIFELFLFYLVNNFSISIMEKFIFDTNKHNQLKDILNSIKGSMGNIIQYNSGTLSNSTENMLLLKLHEIYIKYINIIKTAFIDSINFAYSAESICKYIVSRNEKYISNKYFDLKFNISDSVINSFVIIENDLNNIADIFKEKEL